MGWLLPFLYLAPLRAIVRGGQEPKKDPLKQPPIWLTFMAFSGQLTPCHMPSGTQCLSANHFSFVTLQINLLPSRLQLAKNAKTRLNINIFSFLNFSFFFFFYVKENVMDDERRMGAEWFSEWLSMEDCFELWPSRVPSMFLPFLSFTEFWLRWPLHSTTWSYSMGTNPLLCVHAW